MTTDPIVIIGGGAAGIFAAIKCRSENPTVAVIVLEKTRQTLAKVKISGGGRCNVTHSCFEPKKLVLNYPRGSKELLGPFTHFQPQDTINWFSERGVCLKTERDGRMFPISDSSQTIIDCLLREAKEVGVEIRIENAVTGIKKENDLFCVQIDGKPDLLASRLLIATGSARPIFSALVCLGHKMPSLVPSLFTFNINPFSLKELAGVSVPSAKLQLANTKLSQTGPLLITHWGFSGPAALKLSSFAARDLYDADYKHTLLISWLSEHSQEELSQKIEETKVLFPKKQIASHCPFPLPQSLWKAFLQQLHIEKQWAQLSKQEALALSKKLSHDSYAINGKTTHKEEFVTCGGIALDELHFKSMESKIVKNLYFAGEVIDVDAVTGGFNFQNAWTTAWIAGSSIAHSFPPITTGNSS